jgi:MoxR-like ATPase
MAWTDLQSDLEKEGYIATDDLAMALYISQILERPILLEGEAGVGKTQIAKTLTAILDTELIRLQCYEGLDASNAIYEWNYQRQLLYIRSLQDSNLGADHIEEQVFSEKFLLQRPLLKAIRQKKPVVLLIDEIDRADQEFEAYLLEILSDFQISVAELGTLSAESIPHVILTSNGTRDLSDALRRRCIYSYVPYPDRKMELQILKTKMPEITQSLAAQIIGFVQSLRKEELEKKPGIAEMLDWAAALAGLGINDLNDDPVLLQATMSCLLKTELDKAVISTEVSQRLAGQAG